MPSTAHSCEPFFVYDLGFIPLPNGGMAVLDIDDWKRLSTTRWHRSDEGYARRGIRPYASLHREVLGLVTGDGKVTDHINLDKLDCRKANLRLCSRRENARNRGTKRALKGAYRQENGKWYAAIRVLYKLICIGREYATQEAAARAYDIAAREHFGTFARCNFPEV